MRWALCSIVLFCTPVHATEITITLTEQEQTVLIQLLDQANKAHGLSNAEVVMHFVKKLQAAQQAAKELPKEK